MAGTTAVNQNTTSTLGANKGVKTVDASQTGFAGLTSNDFLKLLISELQNQDPTQPMSNEQLLNQLSQMRSLQSNLELSTTLKDVSLSQQLNSSTGFIGKTIKGTDDNQKSVTGTVSKVVVSNKIPYLQVGSNRVQIKNLLEVDP